MPQEKDHYKELLRRYLDNNCTPQEAEELLDYLQHDASNRMLLAEMSASFIPPAGDAVPEPGPWSERIRQQLQAKIQPLKVIPFYKRWLPKVAAAALLLICAGAVWRYYLHTKEVPPADVPSKILAQQDMPPGGNRAVLTLANGSTVLLDSTANGDIPTQGATKVIKVNGQLIYQANSADARSVSYNTVSTPRGGQYKIVLPDGTLVWLNAASSLRFPTAFTGNERVVTLNGEGYFEVAHQRGNMPFKVQLSDGAVEVLGTHFNIMAYHNEARVKTTLLEGAVNVVHGAHTARLRPGQQASWETVAHSSIQVNNTNAEEAVAWKEGYFQFNRAGLEEVMRQLQRWYNVELRYEGEGGRQREFWGKIPRDARLSEALKILELSNIHCTIAGDTIIIHV
jgi:ferric-dicitrate binding protein FerR (iron transport regulator)